MVAIIFSPTEYCYIYWSNRSLFYKSIKRYDAVPNFYVSEAFKDCLVPEQSFLAHLFFILQKPPAQYLSLDKTYINVQCT